MPLPPNGTPVTNTAKTITAVIGGVLAFIAICVGGWQLHWWTAEHGVNNQYRVNTGSQMYQAGIVSQLRDTVHAYSVATDTGQRAQLRATFCEQYIDLNPAPADLQTAHDTTIGCQQ